MHVSSSSDFLSTYTGPDNDPSSAMEHISERYLSQVRPPSRPKAKKFDGPVAPKKAKGLPRPVYHHFTCATDTDQIKLIFDDVVKSVLDRSLAEAGLA